MSRDCLLEKRASKSSDQKAKSDNSQKIKTQGRVCALTKQDAKASNSVVTGAHTIYSQFAHVLFDYSYTHYFISHCFVNRLNKPSELLEYELPVATPSGNCIMALEYL